MVQSSKPARQASSLPATRRVCSDDDESWAFRTAPAIEYPYVYETTQVATDTGLLDANGNKIMRDPPERRPIGFLTRL